MDLECQADALRAEGSLFVEVMLEEYDADDNDDLDEYDGDSPDEKETATPAEPLIVWQPQLVPMEEAGTGSVAVKLANSILGVERRIPCFSTQRCAP